MDCKPCALSTDSSCFPQGQIGYALLPLLANGQVFGPKTKVHLRLLDIEQAKEALRGVAMELEDGGYTTLGSVMYTSDPEVALKGADVAIFVGGFPRKQGMERKDLIAVNSKIFVAQGKALEKVASKNCKVLVVANPANTNCLLLRMNAPSLPAENFTCLTFLDHNRARAQLSMKASVPIENIFRVAIFGNHSATQVPDAFNAVVKNPATGSTDLISKLVNDDKFLKTSFIKTVQQRGKAIIDARKQSSAMSAANAIADHVRTWLVTGTRQGDTVSMGVYTSKNWYGIKKDLIFSFPVRIEKPGEWTVDETFQLDDDMKKLVSLTQKELEEERDEALEALKQQQQQAKL